MNPHPDGPDLYGCVQDFAELRGIRWPHGFFPENHPRIHGRPVYRAEHNQPRNAQFRHRTTLLRWKYPTHNNLNGMRKEYLSADDPVQKAKAERAFGKFKQTCAEECEAMSNEHKIRDVLYLDQNGTYVANQNEFIDYKVQLPMKEWVWSDFDRTTGSWQDMKDENGNTRYHPLYNKWDTETPEVNYPDIPDYDDGTQRKLVYSTKGAYSIDFDDAELQNYDGFRCTCLLNLTKQPGSCYPSKKLTDESSEGMRIYTQPPTVFTKSQTQSEFVETQGGAAHVNGLGNTLYNDVAKLCMDLKDVGMIPESEILNTFPTVEGGGLEYNYMTEEEANDMTFTFEQMTDPTLLPPIIDKLLAIEKLCVTVLQHYQIDVQPVLTLFKRIKQTLEDVCIEKTNVLWDGVLLTMEENMSFGDRELYFEQNIDDQIETMVDNGSVKINIIDQLELIQNVEDWITVSDYAREKGLFTQYALITVIQRLVLAKLRIRLAVAGNGDLKDALKFLEDMKNERPIRQSDVTGTQTHLVGTTLTHLIEFLAEQDSFVNLYRVKFEGYNSDFRIKEFNNLAYMKVGTERKTGKTIRYTLSDFIKTVKVIENKQYIVNVINEAARVISSYRSFEESVDQDEDGRVNQTEATNAIARLNVDVDATYIINSHFAVGLNWRMRDGQGGGNMICTDRTYELARRLAKGETEFTMEEWESLNPGKSCEIDFTGNKVDENCVNVQLAWGDFIEVNGTACVHLNDVGQSWTGISSLARFEPTDTITVARLTDLVRQARTTAVNDCLSKLEALNNYDCRSYGYAQCREVSLYLNILKSIQNNDPRKLATDIEAAKEAGIANLNGAEDHIRTIHLQTAMNGTDVDALDAALQAASRSDASVEPSLIQAAVQQLQAMQGHQTALLDAGSDIERLQTAIDNADGYIDVQDATAKLNQLETAKLDLETVMSGGDDVALEQAIVALEAVIADAIQKQLCDTEHSAVQVCNKAHITLRLLRATRGSTVQELQEAIDDAQSFIDGTIDVSDANYRLIFLQLQEAMERSDVESLQRAIQNATQVGIAVDDANARVTTLNIANERLSQALSGNDMSEIRSAIEASASLGTDVTAATEQLNMLKDAQADLLEAMRRGHAPSLESAIAINLAIGFDVSDARARLETVTTASNELIRVQETRDKTAIRLAIEAATALSMNVDDATVLLESLLAEEELQAAGGGTDLDRLLEAIQVAEKVGIEVPADVYDLRRNLQVAHAKTMLKRAMVDGTVTSLTRAILYAEGLGLEVTASKVRLKELKKPKVSPVMVLTGVATVAAGFALWQFIQKRKRRP